ncbi:AzlC family ABC transporter permease [Actinokineospora bangkokensis]|uniref:Branched-chain amino acid permease n=1 Tax=Actinokineospora bangkokensis TaxID=1193682 RepID=A0A1Q9LSD2_9PSEU|nr:AzlC family ABC transporter permease [Actinokineospora bangkokensis]OLR94904.1 branched-chain amino acid permease [Actinokineospora bangkokensis]
MRFPPGSPERALLTDVALVALAVTAIALSYGATAVAGGLPLWFPVLLSCVVLAGGAEFLFLGVVLAGGNPLAGMAAGLLVNSRHLPYGLALPDVLGRGPRRLLGVHLMNDESVAMAIAQDTPHRKRLAYWLCGLAVSTCWPLGTALGGLIGTLVPDTAALGLDAVFPAVLLALIADSLRDSTTRAGAVIGAVLALAATPVLPAGLPVLIAILGALVALREPKVRVAA